MVFEQKTIKEQRNLNVASKRVIIFLIRTGVESFNILKTDEKLKVGLKGSFELVRLMKRFEAAAVLLDV